MSGRKSWFAARNINRKKKQAQAAQLRFWPVSVPFWVRVRLGSGLGVRLRIRVRVRVGVRDRVRVRVEAGVGVRVRVPGPSFHKNTIAPQPERVASEKSSSR